MKKNLSVQYLTRIAVLTALASILFLIEIPVVAFYKLDLSNLPVLLGAFSMGPLAGIIILALKSFIGMLHSTSMYVGELADFIMGAALVLPAALMYRRNKTRKTALAGMLVGTLTMIVVAVLVNWKMMIPFYMNAYGRPMEAVVGMATKVLPFVDISQSWGYVRFLALAGIDYVIVWAMYEASKRSWDSYRTWPGALLSTAAMVVVSIVFSVFISASAKYPLVYGSLASVILLMLWLYTICIVILSGAAFNIVIRDLKARDTY